MRRLTVACLAFGTMLSTASCSAHNDVSDPRTLPPAFVVSNSVLSPFNIAGARSDLSQTTEVEGITYVSLPPGSVRDATGVAIENLTKHIGGPAATLIDGGFDPVPVEANEGDEIRFNVFGPGGSQILETLKVPSRRPPVIVRSNPSKGRTDVALNVSVEVVFSEPIDSKTITTESVFLLHNGTRVAGNVVFVDNAWTVKFTPSSVLAVNSSYDLIVTSAVRDLDGDALESQYDAPFTTGLGEVVPPPPPPSNQITGTVFERTPDGPKPIPGAHIYTWVEIGNPGDWGYSAGGTTADGSGKFTITGMPAATLTFSAGAAGYNQPCLKIISYDGSSMTTDIELVSTSRPLAVPSDPTVVKGVVFENTPSGHQPIAGATLYVDRFDDHNMAWTITDENGRYQFCGLVPWHNFGPQIYAGKTGYEWSYNLLTLTGQQEVVLDIELKK